jgi:hypothetical protein
VCGFAGPAIGGGIPTIDVANLTQQLLQYMTQLQGYQEMINQTTTQTNQYRQMIRDYQQVLREYQSYLNQLRGLRRIIDAGDWQRLMVVIEQYHGRAKRSYAVNTMDPESTTYEEDLDAMLSQYGHVPRQPSEVEADARALGVWSEDYARKVREDYEAYELMKDRLRMTSDNARKSKERIEQVLPKHAEALSNLGDESDLATMQHIAAQDLTIMNQMEALIQTQNQVLLNMDNERAERAAQSAKYRDAELQRLRDRQPNKLLGRDRWGYF